MPPPSPGPNAYDPRLAAAALRAENAQLRAALHDQAERCSRELAAAQVRIRGLEQSLAVVNRLLVGGTPGKDHDRLATSTPPPHGRRAESRLR